MKHETIYPEFHPTLFGGDVTGFKERYGPRLYEAAFRAKNDPDNHSTHKLAVQELEELARIAAEWSVSGEEFNGFVEQIAEYGARDGNGDLFIDTEEGRAIYLTNRTGPLASYGDV